MGPPGETVSVQNAAGVTLLPDAPIAADRRSAATITVSETPPPVTVFLRSKGLYVGGGIINV